MPLTAVILAAGVGSRLGDIGKRYSKPTVPVAGRPLIHWIADMLASAGVERLVIVGHPSDRRLAEITRDMGHATLVIQAQRRVIADALHCALPEVADEDAYLACACDSLYRSTEVAALIGMGRRNPGSAIVGVLEMGIEATASRSAVQLDGDDVTEIIEKPAPGTIDSGLVALPLYWLPRAFAAHVAYTSQATNETFISTSLTRFRRSGGSIRALRLSMRLEITTAEDLARAEQVLVRRTPWPLSSR
ncbi:MAG: NTP transferase domain-containing protein [Deltaproteobacteria bacterium]|nr:NTP transferase domain-containing protein [Deltaproteobacteria bacterium]